MVSTRRLLALTAVGAITAALFTGTATARADGYISATEAAYIAAYGAGAVCATIDEYPTPGGVLGVAAAIMEDGFTAGDAVDIINASVLAYCDEHWPLLQRTGALARGEAGYQGNRMGGTVA